MKEWVEENQHRFHAFASRHLLEAAIIAFALVTAGPMLRLANADEAKAEPGAQVADDHADEHEHHHGKDGHADEHEHHHGKDGHVDDHEHHHGKDGHADEHEHHHGKDGHADEHEHHHATKGESGDVGGESNGDHHHHEND